MLAQTTTHPTTQNVKSTPSADVAVVEAEARLVARMIGGDHASWREFQTRYDRLIYRCITKVTGRFATRLSTDDVAEIYATLLLSLLANDKHKLRTYDVARGNRFGSWIGLLAINAAYDHLRSVRRDANRGSLTEAEELTSDTPDPYEICERRERAAKVAVALGDFSEKDRQFVDLYFGEGLEPEEVAVRMQISVKTVYSKKHKIQSKLETLLGGGRLAALRAVTGGGGAWYRSPVALSYRAPIALALTVVLVAACSDGGQGDGQPSVMGSLRGAGHTLAELNDRSRTVDVPPAKAILQVTGTRVTWVDTFDETGTGQVGDVFVQDLFPPPAPFKRGYEGMLLFQPAYSPPSFRPSTGDVLDLSGQYQEFQVPKQGTYLDKTWRTPEMKGATLSLRLDAAGSAVEPVDDATIPDFFAYATGRRWLSMLVTLHDVVVMPCTGSTCNGVAYTGGGRASINLTTMDNQVVPVPPTPAPGAPKTFVLQQPAISNELFDILQVPLQAGQTLKSVTGIVTLFSGFHVAPRTAADIVP